MDAGCRQSRVLVRSDRAGVSFVGTLATDDVPYAGPERKSSPGRAAGTAPRARLRWPVAAHCSVPLAGRLSDAAEADETVGMADIGLLHHVEVRTADLSSAMLCWGWLLDQLNYEPFQQWSGGKSWRRAHCYIVIERASRPGRHDRRLPGLSHLAFHAGTRETVDRLWRSAPQHGWSALYADRHPWAGGPDHYAAFLENGERFKVELVAADLSL
jgi:hypothetical protein